MEVAESARLHRIADPDILHAIAMPMRQVLQGDDRVLIIGADRTGRLLEIVVIDPEGEPAAVHAMELRQKFYRYL